MNKKLTIGLIVLVLFVIAMVVFWATPTIKEAHIQSEIDKANYCEVDTDCVDAGGKCPFGCFVYVHKNEVERISKLIESYESKCVYGCVAESTVICENKKCKEVFDQ